MCVCAQLLSGVQPGNPMDCSPPGFSVHGIFQARILEEVAFPPPKGDLPDPGIEPMSPESPALACGFLPLSHLYPN